jgi:hypothetical protein
VDLHAYQVAQLSYGEFRQAVIRAAADIRATGGRMIDVGQLEGMAAPAIDIALAVWLGVTKVMPELAPNYRDSGLKRVATRLSAR